VEPPGTGAGLGEPLRLARAKWYKGFKKVRRSSVYLDYLKRHAAVIGLGLAITALVVSASLDDLLNGLALVAVVFLLLTPLVQARRAWTRGGRERWVQSGIPLVTWVIGLWIVIRAAGSDDFTKSLEGFQYTGGMVGAFLIFLLFAHFIPLAAKRRKSCPECLSGTGIDARVCASCGYRWLPPLTKQSPR
jgi:hypothetical protein